MKIELEIKKEDIERGSRLKPLRCPIALALSRRFKETIIVGSHTFDIQGRRKFNTLDIDAMTFIRNFDYNKGVKPTTIHVDVMDPILLEKLMNED